MKKLFAIFILCLGCCGILEAQNIWEPLHLPGSLWGVNAQGDMFCIQRANPLNLLRSQDHGETWETVFTGNIGNCIVGKKGRIFLINDRIVNYSDDNGDTWLQTSPITESTDYNHFSRMRMCSPSNDTLVGWESPFLIWTLDGGITWDSTHLDFMEDDQVISSLLVNENGDVYASIWHHIGPNIGVYHSTFSDMRNWELVAFEGLGIKDMAFDPEGNLLCGVDFDGSFSGFEHVPGFYAFWASSIDVSDNGIIYKPSISDANTVVLAYSFDHGEHFYNTFESLPFSEHVPTVLSSGYDNHLYFLGNRQYWRSIPLSDDIPSIFTLFSDWYYEILGENGAITYQHLQCMGDTTVNEERPKIIIRSNTHYDRKELAEVTHEYVYEKDGKVYWWNKDLEEFTVLYDLVAQAGDEWEIKVGFESLMMHVDSVEYYDYEGRTFRVLQVSDENNLFSGDIMCGVGHLTSFFPERLMNQGKGYRVDGLRCCWLDNELIYKLGDEDCDALYEKLHHSLDETTDDAAFAVYPNPANNVLFVETRHGTPLPTIIYRITNLMGQTVLSGNITAENQRIDISIMPQGMYFISVGEQTIKFVVK